MNTVPMPVKRPLYTTTVGRTEAEWIAENLDDLQDWFTECEGELANVVEFHGFCSVQFDLTQDNDELMKDAFAEWARENDAYDRLKGEQIDAELGDEA